MDKISHIYCLEDVAAAAAKYISFFSSPLLYVVSKI